jgi:hypothetical protein
MEWIAQESFRCHPREGEPFDLSIKIGKPSLEPADGALQGYAVCVVSFDPLVKEKRIPGENEFQALCLALDHLRVVLKIFTGEGGRVYWRDTDSLVDLASPWFCPFPSLAEVGLRHQRPEAQ